MKSKLISLWTGRILPFLKRLFLRHWGTKLISLVFAVFLWNYAVLTLETSRNVVINDVPLTVTNAAALRQRGLALSKSVHELVESARVTVSTTLSSAGHLSRERVTVSCDLSQINSAGTHTLNLTGRSSYGQVISIYPNSITLDVEALATREFPVTVLTSGTTAEGCSLGAPILSAETVTATGPQALLASIQDIIARVPLNKSKDDVRESVTLEMLDAQGLPVASPLISLNRSDVIVTIPVRHVQSFPLLTEDLLIGEDQLAEGYHITSIDVYPQTLEVEGNAQAIASLQAAGGLTLSQCDVTGASADVRSYSTVYLPSGASLAQNRSILVIVRIEREMTSVEIKDVPVELRGVSEGLRGQMSAGTVDVTLTGPKASLDHLPAGHVQLYVDASDRAAGSFTLPVTVLIDERYEAQVQLSRDVLQVVLTEIQPEQ